jgi:hypothetical protein
MSFPAIFEGLIKQRGARFHGRRVAISATVVCLLLLVSCTTAKADVGVILNDSLDTSVARVLESGHSAVYLSRICPESPVKLRLCRAGESGSVISTYINLGEDHSFAWNIVPLNVYLYGVEDPRNRPLFGTNKIKRALEDNYRDTLLSPYCQQSSCQTSDKAEWREMVGAALSRNIYIFVVDTSVEQDLELIAKLNSLPNEDHFNGVTRNCADFARDLINTYFPHATGTNYMNDFGIASPKAIARSFTRYALRHPETRFRVLHIPQLPGDLKQSSEPRMATEQMTHSKEWLVPMVVVAAHELPFVAASYELTGRFNPEHEFEQHPTAEATDIAFQIRSAKGDNDKLLVTQLKAKESHELAKFVGSGQDWKQDRKTFNSIVDEAVHEEVIPTPEALKRLFARLDAQGTPFFDSNGELWMTVSDDGGTYQVGLSADNLLATGSDPQLAYAVLLARIHTVMESSKYRREPLPDLQADLDLLRRARANSVPAAPSRSDLFATGAPGGVPQRLVSWVKHLLS